MLDLDAKGLASSFHYHEGPSPASAVVRFFVVSLCFSVLTRCRYLEGSDAYIFVPIGESVNVQSLTVDRATGEMLLNREPYICPLL